LRIRVWNIPEILLYNEHERENRMKSRSFLSLVIPAILSGSAYAGPWFVDLEESIQTLPWVITGDVLQVNDSSVTAVVTDSFLGQHLPGDTLLIPFWEMGSWMTETFREDDGYLLIPDDTGSLQIVGTPGNGFWLLKGYFDFNAFFAEPGVLSKEELILLCSGDSLPDRSVDVEVRFAGGSEFIEVALQESGSTWLSHSHYSCLDGLTLENYEFIMGGMDNYPYEPEVYMRVSTAGGGIVLFHGKMDSCTDGTYECTVYPTGLLILDSISLAEYITTDRMPETIRIGLEISGANPADLGLSEDPVFTLGESGYLHLSGAEGLLDITSMYFIENYSRPVMGFDRPMTCSHPLYFDFENLPEGPSGHLATDIIDALAKGTVSGTIGWDPTQPAARFSLHIMREE
jgi:hypothetical protein